MFLKKALEVKSFAHIVFSMLLEKALEVKCFAHIVFSMHIEQFVFLDCIKSMIMAETSLEIFRLNWWFPYCGASCSKEIDDFLTVEPPVVRREDSKYSSTLRVHASRISRAYQTRDWQDSASQKHSFWSRKLTRLTRKFRQPQLKSKKTENSLGGLPEWWVGLALAHMGFCSRI